MIVSAEKRGEPAKGCSIIHSSGRNRRHGQPAKTAKSKQANGESEAQKGMCFKKGMTDYITGNWVKKSVKILNRENIL